MSTIGQENDSFPSIFKGCQRRTGHLKKWGALPVISPFLQLTWFQGHQTATMLKMIKKESFLWSKPSEKKKKKRKFDPRLSIHFWFGITPPALTRKKKAFLKWKHTRFSTQNRHANHCWFTRPSQMNLLAHLHKKNLSLLSHALKEITKAIERKAISSSIKSILLSFSPRFFFLMLHDCQKEKRTLSRTSANFSRFSCVTTNISLVPSSGILTWFPFDRRWKCLC